MEGIDDDGRGDDEDAMSDVFDLIGREPNLSISALGLLECALL
jgi:hypothetical protein